MPDEVKLKPGEHRVVRTQPCPPHMYTHPNGYWFLKRVARHFLQDEFNLIWDNDGYFESALVTLRKLRETAKLFSATPWKKWEQERMGEVQEI